MQTTMRVGSPEQVVGLVPMLVGFDPIDSLVVLGMADSRVVVAMRLDLAEPGALDVGAWMPENVVQACDEAIVLVWRPSSVPLTDLDTGPLDDSPLPLRDVLIYDGERLWSAGCSDECECGLGVGGPGVEVPLPPLPTRDDLVAQAQFTGPDVAEWGTDGRVVGSWHEVTGPADLLATCRAGIAHRDLLLATMTDRPEWDEARITEAAQVTDDDDVLAVLACVAFVSGKGALAWALRDRSDTSLANLLDVSMRAGLPPSQMVEAFTDALPKIKEALA